MTTTMIRTESVSGRDSVRTMTDEYIASWLNEHHPTVARDFAREARRIEDQQWRECPYACDKAGRCLLDDIVLGIPAADLISAYGKHWAFQLFPGCGSLEICKLAADVLTAREACVLTLTFGEGLHPDQAAARLHTSKPSIYRWLQAIRRKLVAARRDGRLAQSEVQCDRFDFWKSLQSACPTVYRRPARLPRRAAYVCDCGRHLKLNKDYLDHWRVDPTISKDKMRNVVRERHLKCPCGKRYPESEWASIASGFGNGPARSKEHDTGAL